MRNWKTTLAGIASIIGAVSLFINDPSKTVEAVTALTVGFGLLFAKDSNVK